MIYRVVIIDNGNQVSLTQQGHATPIMEVSGDIEPIEETRWIMEDALELLKGVKELDDTNDN